MPTSSLIRGVADDTESIGTDADAGMEHEATESAWAYIIEAELNNDRLSIV